MSSPDSSISVAKDVQERVSRWVRPEVLALDAYSVPNAEGLVKLDAMENPFSWPQAMQAEWLEVLNKVELNRYPAPQAEPLKACLRRQMGLADHLDLVLGNGSDELIQILQMVVGGAERCVIAPTPTFVMYELIARFTGSKFVGVPLTESFELDSVAMLKAIEQDNPALVFIAYPNNPTGNLFKAETVATIIRATDGLVVIDEAYHAYADSSFLPELEAYPNVLVMRTLSKLGLAGLRLGMLIGQRDWLVQCEKVRLPYNINSLSQFTAEFALKHEKVFAQQVETIRSERQRLTTVLAGLNGLQVYSSQANFILFRVAGGCAKPIHAALLSDGVLIKNLDGSAAALKDCLRVTVGKPDENNRFIIALKSALGN